MSERYLIKSTNIYRLDSEQAAKDFIEKRKKSNHGELVKYTSEYKERKAKGEVVDAWYRVTLTTVFNDEKEPEYPDLDGDDEETTGMEAFE